ncbi:MAG TPA: protein-glutamate O-methyltransferase CheR [Blastocatellia bacterium]|nr:protein-glutamate O-methyltransferase CheR [Blastocatellia bacterium]
MVEWFRRTRAGLMYQYKPRQERTETLSESEFRLFRDLIYEECGFYFGSEKRTFLESRLRRRMDELGIRSGYEYYNLVKHSGEKVRELPTLLDILMICETSFFRNLPQFDLLRTTVLPEMIMRKERTRSRTLRLWSAGCSTGQEPYSAVMTMLETLPDAGGWNIRVIASDLSFTALERAQSGRYRPDQLKGVQEELVRKYFRKESGSFVVSDQVKRHVIFDYHNLKHDNGLRGLDIIFCRNVMIYFDMEEQRRLVTRFSNCLVPGGYLFIGHAESLQGLSNRFTMIHQNKGIAYRLDG